MTDQSYRDAAESLLGSISTQRFPRNYGSHSVNLLNEDLVAGHRPQGTMSTVRRFFCLFITFDLLFTCLMWLICVMIRGESMSKIFNSEIVNYNIKTSLFDIVVVGVIRFSVLLMFYAALYISNWSVIALSTGGTCAFLIAKVFLYDWPDASEPVYQVFLILTSFTLSWAEAWFLDFRVLPMERQAKSLLDAISHHAPHERTSLLAPPPRPYRVGSVGDSTANWFSPVDTPEASPAPPNRRLVILTQEHIDDYKKNAEASLQDTWSVLNLPNWKEEKKGVIKGDVVESMVTEKFGKVFRFTGIVDCPSKFLFEELKNHPDKYPEWNPTILRSDIIKVISDDVDLTYQVTAGGGRGIISPRDFVMLRMCSAVTRDGAACPTDGDVHAYLCTGVSVEVPGYPPNKDMVRAQSKVGGWCMRPVSVKSTSGKIEQMTKFQWIMCCDLKGKIPQFVLDTAFSTAMLDYIVFVRKFAAESKAKGLF